MDVPTKAFTQMGLTSLDLPRLECDLQKTKDNRSSSGACTGNDFPKRLISDFPNRVVEGASASVVDGALEDRGDAGSEAGSQDSLAVEVDAEVPSSMSSLDDDDEFDDMRNRNADDRLVVDDLQFKLMHASTSLSGGMSMGRGAFHMIARMVVFKSLIHLPGKSDFVQTCRENEC